MHGAPHALQRDAGAPLLRRLFLCNILIEELEVQHVEQRVEGHPEIGTYNSTCHITEPPSHHSTPVRQPMNLGQEVDTVELEIHEMGTEQH